MTAETSTQQQQLDQLAAWPKTEDDVTVDGMLRCIGVDAQITYLEKWRLLGSTRPKDRTPEQLRLHHLAVLHEINAIGLMGAIRALRKVSPAAADEFARDHWLMCDDGSAFGELLWEWLAEAGVDPKLIKLPEDEQSAAVTE